MNKTERRLRRKKGIRKRVFGTAKNPRISVFKSNRHIYVQAIDDEKGITIISASDFEKGIKGNLEGATKIGELLAKRLKEKKINEGVFDRNGYPYHGLIKAVCEGARKGGLKI
ncbi:MAG: 50S ribosomal protein L18 [Spirochaetota bacterium]|nr:MAG: 50S ribosomal protein L18 [Spirochaetota bacterium]